MKLLLTPIFILLMSLHAFSEEMSFDNRCMGNAAESCAIIASGVITKQTPDKFREYVENEFSDGEVVLLHSKGGNLAGGVELGRAIREYGLSTEIGNGVSSKDEFWEWPGAGVCESACAYAFMGGRRRAFDNEDKLGFHRFYSPTQNIDGESAQVLSGLLVQYMVEMGIDARVFTFASQENDRSMFYPNDAQAQEFALKTPYGFDHFKLEPYKQGIVAYSKRKGDVDLYDLTMQLTAYCKRGSPKLLYLMAAGLTEAANFLFSVDDQKYTVSADKVSVKPAGDEALLEVTLSKAQATSLTRATSMSSSFDYYRAIGGFFPYGIDLNDVDRQSLAAAFKFCIS